jgi:hypothetical protein
MRNADIVEFGQQVSAGATGQITLHANYTGYSNAATNRYKVRVNNSSSAVTNAAGATATIPTTGARAWRLKNAGE